MKWLVKVVGVKKVVMVDLGVVQCFSGYIMGGVSLLGQKKVLCIFIDDFVNGFIIVFVSVGCRGLEIELSFVDLSCFIDGVFVGLFL